MGIDIGTQSSRVALLDLHGHIVASAGALQDMQTPRPGWAEQDPQMWWDNTVNNTRRVLSQPGISPKDILGIGVSGQMHGAVPLDSKGELLSHGVQLWCDKRSADLVEQLKTQPGFGKAFHIAANPPVANWVGFKLKWIQVFQPEIYSKIWKVIVPKDYINYKLTGAVVIDHSEASGAFLMDAKTKKWSNELIQLVGIDGEKLPEIHAAYEVIGKVTAEVANLTGLLEGTPVVAGGGDMLCMLLAAGITQPGRASDVTGTSSIMSVFTEEPVFDPRLMNLHHVMPGWIPFGIIDSGGGSLKWFKDSFCQREVAEAKQKNIEVYDILNELAQAVEPGTEGLFYYP